MFFPDDRVQLMKLRRMNEFSQLAVEAAFLLLMIMFLSKSFGYALRAVLYIALVNDEKKRVQVDEIAQKISVPKHFLGKIMNRLVKEGLLNSTKGPYGGFSINPQTLSTPLMRLVSMTDGISQFNTCILKMEECKKEHPCPLHNRVEPGRIELMKTLNETTIEKLIPADKKNLLRSIAKHRDTPLSTS